jgi:hypothetical protein
MLFLLSNNLTKGIAMFVESLEGRQMFSAPGLFEIEDYSFDIEQVLNIGSQSSGAGAGKAASNPSQVTHKVDSAAPVLVRSA